MIGGMSFMAGRFDGSPDLLADMCTRCTGEGEVRDPDRPEATVLMTCPACLGDGRRGWRNDGNPPPMGS